MKLHTVAYTFVVAGTVAFAVTAVIAMAPKGGDLFGAMRHGDHHGRRRRTRHRLPNQAPG